MAKAINLLDPSLAKAAASRLRLVVVDPDAPDAKVVGHLGLDDLVQYIADRAQAEALRALHRRPPTRAGVDEHSS